MDLHGYDRLAAEYYQPRHITSRNFDAATRAHFHASPIALPDVGLALDLGAGRGRLGEYCDVPQTRIVQVDLSFNMLALGAREPSAARLVSDALALPFRSAAFAVVAAFLFDPFNCRRLFAHVARVMTPGAIFVGTLPHYEWGRALRAANSSSIEESIFLLENGHRVIQPSLLSPPETLAERLQSAGLAVIRNLALTLPRSVTEISPDIQLPARLLKTSAYRLPIIQLLVATKL